MRCRLFRKIIPERRKEDMACCCCRHLHRGLLRGAREQASRSPRGPHTSIFPLTPLRNAGFAVLPIGGASYSAGADK
ncbi:hypothetical protein BDFB_010455 [Asbolus verrucosus]|uniref:Uncharacterized protein n=1 Tax=Asbolus verrucosus TaxID=1661398 RepID=A0A482W262_ASBVE|nr:hypothetical protein BDFB_010455 [Asbolus verrucosus]